jgi:hypothetical protein
VAGLGIADDGGNRAGLQRLLHGPQQAGGLGQRHGDEALAGKPQPLQPVAVEPAMFALMRREAAPEERAALLRVAQAAKCQGEREAHGGRLVAIGARRHVMKAGALQALRGKMAVGLGEPQEPGGAFPARALELRMPLLRLGDQRTQGLDQGCDMIALTERGGAGASFPTPRTRMCRFNTHDCDDPECSYFVPQTTRRVKRNGIRGWCEAVLPASELDEKLAEVPALEQADEGGNGALEAVHHMLTVFHLPRGQPAAHVAQEILLL